MMTSPGIAYLNRQFLPLSQICISPLDRGFLFADGVYEVIPVYDGRLFRLKEHLQRLVKGLDAIRLDVGLKPSEWSTLLGELVSRNGGGELVVYLQVTRGAPPIRDHAFPADGTRPTILAMASPLKPVPATVLSEGISAVTHDDIRWGACHIKSTALLANVLARQHALDQGCHDAILVRDGFLTEGSASNLFLVQGDFLLTPIQDQRILPGITRRVVLELAAANGISYREENIPAASLETAGEIWLTSSTKEILPVTVVNGRAVGTGLPGPLWRHMTELYQAYKRMICPLITV
jgi:D-alanine transaminase